MPGAVCGHAPHRPSRRSALGALLLAAVLAAPLLAACGSGDGGNTVRWFVFQEPSGAYNDAITSCNREAGGRYEIVLEPLPTNADQQRELLVRRLAANDSTIDIMGMDVIWTAEFAQAGWLRPWEGDLRRVVIDGVLAGPLATATYQDTVWTAPFTSNTQLLWYRKSLVPQPPTTWDEMIDQAEALPADRNRIQIQGNRYEGYTVWVNSLIQSAGTEVVENPDDPDKATAGLEQGPTEEALAVIRRLGNSPVADPSLSVSTEDTTRLAFEAGTSAFELNYPFVYPSAMNLAPDVFRDMAWARYPAVRQGEKSRPPLGGINLGISAHSTKPELAFEAATCLRSAANQKIAAIKGGLPPTLESVYDEPEMKKQYPFGDLLRESIADAAPRPITPAYNDVSLAIQRTLHPPSGVDPQSDASRLRDIIDKALKSQAVL
jgi:multiple sugar transport system substrate-binding protein